MAKLKLASVSELSEPETSEFDFDAERWQFPVTTAGSSSGVFAMQWAIPLVGGIITVPAEGEAAKGTLYDDPTYAVLLKSWRTVLHCLVVEPRDGGPRKGSICSRMSTGLRTLVPWMVATGRLDLGTLDAHAFAEFVEALTRKAVDDSEEDNAGRWGPEGITAEAASTYLYPFRYARSAWSALESSGLPHPKTDPLDGRAAIDIAKEICAKVSKPVAEITDAVFIASTRATASLLGESWVEPLIVLSNRLATAEAATHDALCRTFIDDHLIDVDPRTPAKMVVRGAVARVRAACMIAIQSLSGIRISELCGIEDGGTCPKTRLPRCIVIELTFDDAYELFILNAELYKHTTSSEPVSWVLGLRPTGSDYLPPPVAAMDVLSRLDAGWREMSGITALLISFGQANGFPNRGCEVIACQAAHVRHWQQRWLAERGCIEGDQRLTTQMWRKTFARYLVRVSADLLPAISHHLKHMSIAMTEVGYCRPDPTMRRLIEDARVEEAGSVIMGVISGRSPIEGPVAAEIRRYASEVGRRVANRSPDDQRSDIVAEAKERKVSIYGGAIGWCVFRADGASCHLLKENPLPAMLRLAPAFENRTPEVCQTCTNFGIGQEHEPFWRARRKRLEDAHATCGRDDHPAIGERLRLALQRCDTVLGWMENPSDV